MNKPYPESGDQDIDPMDDEFEDHDEGEMEVVYVGQGGAEASDADDEVQEERAIRPNKTALKREMVALQKLAGRLLEFSQQRLASLEFSEKTTLALAEGRRLKKPDARRRHLRYLAKLLTNENVEAAEAFIENIDGRHATNTRHFHQLEQWRDRLIDEGDQALEALLQEQPGADRQQLRQLIRKAKQEREKEKPPAAARKLFKLLRALYEQ